MEELIVDKEKWIVVDPSTQPTVVQSNGTQTTSNQYTGMSKEDWENLNRRERSTIRLFLENSVLLNMLG
jgi:hypothetical protein